MVPLAKAFEQRLVEQLRQEQKGGLLAGLAGLEKALSPSD